jgi:regulator of protease activity HflC (stomatin/prohibitin superfamily)
MGDQVLVFVCGLLDIIFVLDILLAVVIRIIPETQRLVVFRLGRYLGVRGPGLVLLLPAIDRGIKVDLREQERSLPGQNILTGDKYPVTVETHWSYKIIDPMASELEVEEL